MSAEIHFGIIAALEHEIAPLISGWRAEQVHANGRFYKAYVTENAVLMLAGMGNASAVTKVLVETYAPEVLISTGFAGALVSNVRVPALLVPQQIVSEETGETYRSEVGFGRLVTARNIADSAAKRHLAERYSADAVDMEAAQVAEIAAAHGCGFVAVKAVSDNVDTDVAFLGKFVEGQRFRTGAFVAYIAVRPWLWRAVAEMNRNTDAARRNLCGVLKSIIREAADYKTVIEAALDVAALQSAKQVG